MINFLIIGAQKAGTTALSAYLENIKKSTFLHSKVHFFDDESQEWKNKASVRSTYHANFPSMDLRPDILSGDATPIYSYWAPAMQRIWSYNSAIKLILCLKIYRSRHSHWAMEVKRDGQLISKKPSNVKKNAVEKLYPITSRLFLYF